jgi:ABC-type multidrug transport system fused ATPase/permease subunit
VYRQRRSPNRIPLSDLARCLRSVKPLLQELLRGRWYRLGIGLVMVMVGRGASLVMPASTKYLVDDVILKRDTSFLLLLILWVLGATLLQAGTSVVLTQILSVEGIRLIAHLRRKLQQHLGLLAVSFFDKQKAGALATRIVADTEMIRNIMGVRIVEFVGSILGALYALIFLLRLNVRMTITVVVFAVLSALLSNYRLGYMHQIVRQHIAIRERVIGRLVESISGIRVVKAYHAEASEARLFSSGFDQLMNASYRSIRASSFMGFINTMFMAGITVSTMYLAVGEIARGGLTLGGFMTFAAFSTFLTSPMTQLTGLGTALTEALAALEHSQEILREVPENQDPRRTRVADTIRGKVTFDRVGFEYDPGKPVLHDITFEAMPGSVTALVGPSGAGKSTIIALVAAFYAPCRGTIYVDDIDASTLDLASYRSHFAVVFQETFLFDGTIRDNIAFGRPEASMADILQVSRLTQIDQFVDRLPDGYDTMVGERGIRLSGGQRQRVSIARAILADPAILILDEATSNLDSESEAAIQAGLAHLMQSRTTFVIAHRLSTIRRADQILFVENGRIVERGTHDSLYSAQGRYHQLWLRYQNEPANDLLSEPRKQESGKELIARAAKSRGVPVTESTKLHS